MTAPDVSTLEVNLKKAYVENLTIWLTQALPSQDTCTPEVKYVDASRGAKTLNIVFQIAGCSDQPLRAEFAFQAV